VCYFTINTKLRVIWVDNANDNQYHLHIRTSGKKFLITIFNRRNKNESEKRLLSD
jgi:hypothetical protein